MQKSVPKNFAKFTRKHLCQSLFLTNLQAWPATLLKKRHWHRCFPVHFAKFLRTLFFTEHLCTTASEKERNFCVSLLRKRERGYVSNFKAKSVSTNKTFRRTVKRFFPDKAYTDLQRYSYKKVFWKYAANLQATTYAKVLCYLKSHFGMGVLL